MSRGKQEAAGGDPGGSGAARSRSQGPRGRDARTHGVLLLASLGLGLLGAELLFRRVAPAPRFAANADEDLFWRSSAELGWDHRPGASGFFSNGYFRGEAHFDGEGIRRNAAAGTRLADAPDVFFLGDSTAVSLEVDDDETVPARLEQELRRRGRRVNVLNLGVRGYGTDQSVRRALQLARRRPPAEVVYLFCDNDTFDNGVLHQPTRRYGKGAYVRDASGRFAPLRWPVPEDPLAYFGIVLPDAGNAPRVLEGTTRIPPGSGFPPPRRAAGLRDLFATARFLGRLYDAFVPSGEYDRKSRRWRDSGVTDADLRVDPAQDTVAFFSAVFWASVDGGLLRERDAAYHGSQMRFLLGLLREMPGLRRIHLVQFPSDATLALRAAGRPSTNARLFARLRAEGVVDSWVDLNEELERDGIRPESLQCPGDAHFCEDGNLWIARKILAGSGLGTASPAP